MILGRAQNHKILPPTKSFEALILRFVLTGQHILCFFVVCLCFFVVFMVLLSKCKLFVESIAPVSQKKKYKIPVTLRNSIDFLALDGDARQTRTEAEAEAGDEAEAEAEAEDEAEDEVPDP